MTGVRSLGIKTWRLLWFPCLALIGVQCFSYPDCVQDATNQVNIALKTADGTAIREVTFTRITVSGSSEIFFANKKTSRLQLPLNANTREVNYTFEYEGLVKNLTLSYTTELRLISPECPVQTYFLDLALVSSSFGEGNVIILNPVVLDNDAVHVEIRL
jgi:hypothetical protein